MTDILTIAHLEFTGAARLRWIRLLAAAFALLSAGAAYAAGAAGDLSGADGFARTTLTLVPVALILVPLAAIVLGVSGQTAEAGAEAFLFAQPVHRTTILAGRWIGETGALSAAIALGFGAGGSLMAMTAGPDGLASFLLFIGLTIVLGAIFLSLAAAIGAMSETRAGSLGLATFVWFFFVLLFDAAALSLAGYFTGAAGGRLLFGSLFANPAGLIRVCMLLTAGTSSVLGAAGEALIRFLGGPARADALAAAALAIWLVVPLAIAAFALRRREL